MFEATALALVELTHGVDFTLLAGTEDLPLTSPSPSSDICIVKDVQRIKGQGARKNNIG